MKPWHSRNIGGNESSTNERFKKMNKATKMMISAILRKCALGTSPNVATQRFSAAMTATFPDLVVHCISPLTEDDGSTQYSFRISEELPLKHTPASDKVAEYIEAHRPTCSDSVLAHLRNVEERLKEPQTSSFTVSFRQFSTRPPARPSAPTFTGERLDPVLLALLPR